MTHQDSSTPFITAPGKREREPQERFAVGKTILDRYKITGELGRGGMGAVYKCFDETAGIEVAIKLLPPELSRNTYEMEDIKENFSLVTKLVHQNIAIAKNLEKDKTTGEYFLVMELIDGVDLRRWIKQKRKGDGISLPTVIGIVKKIAEALDYAHKEKVIHRDIKPENIMVTRNGKVKVLDFGLAAQIHTSMTRASIAFRNSPNDKGGSTSGTGPYMAPEQWRGLRQSAATDQYALGVLTYELLAGRLPFESSDSSILQQIVLTQDAEPLEDVPTEVRNAVIRALRKNPAERFANCTEFAAALAGKSVSDPFAAPSSPPKRGRFLAAAIALMLIICFAGYGAYLYQTNAEKAASQAKEAAAQEAERERIAAAEAKKAVENRKAGDRMVLTIKGVEYPFRWCPAGTFTMGSPESELGRYSWETQHSVTLTQGFWMLETEVTQQMWEGVTGENPSKFKGAKLPVESVSWEDCQEFIKQLNGLGQAPSSFKYSLPTEAQWEYACRAGTTTALNNGKSLTDEKYNCPNLYEVAWYNWRDKETTTHPVGQKKANAWGLYDMHGNVWEWCNDWYDTYPSGSVTDPTGPSTSSYRVLRGGSWDFYAGYCRSAYRRYSAPSSRFNGIGLRLALVCETK